MSVEETVARWRAEEAVVRARLAAGLGFVRPHEIDGRTGIQVFEAIFAGELPRPPMGDTLDFVPIHIEAGLAVFQGRPQLKHYNPLGTVHGGWFAALLVPFVMVASLVDVPFTGGFGSRTYFPESLDQGSATYRLVAGRMVNPIEWWDQHWIDDRILRKLREVR